MLRIGSKIGCHNASEIFPLVWLPFRIGIEKYKYYSYLE